MNTFTRRIAGVVGSAALAAVVLAPSAAQAETVTVHDGADATGSLGDIHDVSVRHGADQVRVSASFADLRKHNAGALSAAVFIDTDSRRKGPEFVLATGLEFGTDYQLVKMRNWKPKGEPLACGHSVKLKYAKDVAKFRIARSCIGSPSKVRVGMKMVDTSDGSHVITDWMKGKRKFTRWLAPA